MSDGGASRASDGCDDGGRDSSVAAQPANVPTNAMVSEIVHSSTYGHGAQPGDHSNEVHVTSSPILSWLRQHSASWTALVVAAMGGCGWESCAGSIAITTEELFSKVAALLRQPQSRLKVLNASTGVQTIEDFARQCENLASIIEDSAKLGRNPSGIWIAHSSAWLSEELLPFMTMCCNRRVISISFPYIHARRLA